MPAEDMQQFTSVFRVGDAHRIKRSRAALSCTACQRRKSKCDRSQPCSACERRGDANSCRFGPISTPSGKQDLQARLNRLEQLVKDLAEPPAPEAGEPRRNGSDCAKPSEPTGRSPASEPERTYHGPTSWAAIVESIHDIRTSLQLEGDGESEPSPDHTGVGLDIVLANDQISTSGALIECLPPRAEMDRLVQAYFNSKFVATIFLHAHHFRRRYEAFLEDPSTTSYLWISILYSVLSIGALITRTRHSAAVSLPHVAEPATYMAKASQCLVRGEYLKAKPFAVEALLMHAQCRNVVQKDFDSTIWSLYGIAIRIAQRKGYHRSSDKICSSITPFEAEMRRRAWCLMQSADLMYSFQLGMPTMINEDFCDAGLPTNLTDEDFDEDTSLPPPRSSHDPSPMLAYIVKGSMCKILRRIMHHVLAVAPSTVSDTIILDAQLAECYASIPACLRMRPIRSTAFTDQNYTIMHRIMLEVMYLKTLCVLHRPYLSTGHTDAQHQRSRETCRNAALRMLDVHIELDRETREGGRLYEDRYMVTSLAMHDFLVAAMVVCLDLSESTDISAADRVARVKVLKTVHEIWVSKSHHSKDALHASRVLGAILNKVSLSGRSNDCSPDSLVLTPNHEFLAGPDQVLHQPDKVLSVPEVPMLNVFDTFVDVGSGAETLNWVTIDEFLRQDTSDMADWQLSLGNVCAGVE